jgi:hypothetical protein
MVVRAVCGLLRNSLFAKQFHADHFTQADSWLLITFIGGPNGRLSHNLRGERCRYKIQPLWRNGLRFTRESSLLTMLEIFVEMRLNREFACRIIAAQIDCTCP